MKLQEFPEKKTRGFCLLEKHDFSPKLIKKFRAVIVFIHLGLMTPCYIFFKQKYVQLSNEEKLYPLFHLILLAKNRASIIPSSRAIFHFHDYGRKGSCRGVIRSTTSS